jgi:hypothetical protein
MLLAINRLLDLKIVQWGLLVLCGMMIIGAVVAGIKYQALRIENGLLKIEVAKSAEVLHDQNRKIKEADDAARAFQENALAANKRAAQVALETSKALKSLAEYSFEGDCSTQAATALELIKAHNGGGQ